MENIKKQIQDKLKKIELMINNGNNREEIELERKELDRLLNEYINNIKN